MTKKNIKYIPPRLRRRLESPIASHTTAHQSRADSDAHQNIDHTAVKAVSDIANHIKNSRKEQGLKQADLANVTGVGTRFISDLENGKVTAQIGKALMVMRSLGIRLELK